MKTTLFYIITATIMALATPLQAASLTVPNTFSAGTPAVAAEVNSNFGAVETAVDDNDSRIAALEAALAAHIADSTNPHAVTKAQIDLANIENIRVNYSATTAPTVNDDINSGYSVGSVWIDVTLNQAYVLFDSTPTSAIWKQIIHTYVIGQMGPAGGKVFYVTDGGLHGLEAAPVDQVSAVWGCTGTSIVGADGTTVGTGAQNTADIVAGCITAGIAARIADDYELNGYTDWFLPSKDELNLLYLQKDVAGGFSLEFYWNSSEFDSSHAWGQIFSDGNQIDGSKSATIRVRVVRAF